MSKTKRKFEALDRNLLECITGVQHLTLKNVSLCPALDTCDEWKNSGYTTAGYYFVQRTSESSSVTGVYCEFTKGKNSSCI